MPFFHVKWEAGQSPFFRSHLWMFVYMHDVLDLDCLVLLSPLLMVTVTLHTSIDRQRNIKH